jgi:hypothetical protein
MRWVCPRPPTSDGHPGRPSRARRSTSADEALLMANAKLCDFSDELVATGAMDPRHVDVIG